MDKLLITSALKETWIKDEKFKRIFLTTACLTYNEKKEWENLDRKVLNYHWDNRKKLKDDFNYLNKVYEEGLIHITSELNSYHETDNSIAYWRIIVGPWFSFYIHSLFDKWEMLKKAFEKNQIYFTAIESESKRFIAPKDYSDFLSFINTDIWNFKICSRILKSIYIQKIKPIQIPKQSFLKEKKKFSIFSFFKKKVNSIFELILKLISSKNKKIFILLRKLPFSRLARLNFYFHQIPQRYLNTFYLKTENLNQDIVFRQKQIKFKSKNDFEKHLYENIFLDIPASYLENFYQIKTFVKAKKINPEIIITDVEHYGNDVFKVWLANQKNMEKTIVSVNHGGSIPLLFNFPDQHDEIISDRLITFYKSKNIKQVQLPPYFVKKGSYYKNRGKYCSIIGFEHNRYAYKAASMPISNRTMDVFNFTLKFSESLNKEIFDFISIRPYTLDLGWNTKKRYEDFFGRPKISSDESFNSFIKNAKIIVCSYPQTTFSQAMASNKPTILIYDPEYNEYPAEAEEVIDKLKSAKIIFNDPYKAASHVNLNWNNIEEWWLSDGVVSAKNYFYKIALKVNANWDTEWEEFFDKEINNRITKKTTKD